MFGRKAKHIAELEEALDTRHADYEALERQALGDRRIAAEESAEAGRLRLTVSRYDFADSAQEVLGAFGSDGHVDELALGNALRGFDDAKLTTLNVRMQVAAARINEEAARRG